MTSPLCSLHHYIVHDVTSLFITSQKLLSVLYEIYRSLWVAISVNHSVRSLWPYYIDYYSMTISCINGITPALNHLGVLLNILGSTLSSYRGTSNHIGLGVIILHNLDKYTTGSTGIAFCKKKKKTTTRLLTLSGLIFPDTNLMLMSVHLANNLNNKMQA